MGVRRKAGKAASSGVRRRRGTSGGRHRARGVPRRTHGRTERTASAVRRVRALSPHIGAWTTLHGRRVTIWKARLDDGEFVPEVVQPEGRSQMTYDEFLRGVR